MTKEEFDKLQENSVALPATLCMVVAIYRRKLKWDIKFNEKKILQLKKYKDLKIIMIKSKTKSYQPI